MMCASNYTTVISRPTKTSSPQDSLQHSDGVLQEVSELLLYSNECEDSNSGLPGDVQRVQFDLRFVSSDHLKALIP